MIVIQMARTDMQPTILGISGSRRHDSVNRRLLAAAGRILADAGACFTQLDWDRMSLPLYDGDLEKECGLPAAAVRLKRLIASHDGLLIASPEYNGSITPLLKNAIDWASRPGTPSAVFRDKPVALLAASPGGLGGLRALYHLRDVLTNLGALVLPRQYALGRAGTAFGPEDDQLHPDHREAVSSVTGALLGAAYPAEGTPELKHRRA